MLRRGLLLFVLLLAAGWHAWGLWRRYRPVAPAEAVALLRNGTADAALRGRCLAALRDAVDPEPHARVLAVAAAIALEDRTAYAQLAARLGRAASLITGTGESWPPPDRLDAELRDLALGEHWLHHLLRGQWLRSRGDPAARDELTAAAASAAWSNVGFGAELAQAALAQLPGPGR
ncbi:MAG: hypothetical protein R3F56_20490 [Planctomycetota bacterium]